MEKVGNIWDDDGGRGIEAREAGGQLMDGWNWMHQPIARCSTSMWCTALLHTARHFNVCTFYCTLHCAKINCASSTRAATKLRWEKKLGSRELSVYFNPYQTTGKIWLHICYIYAPKRKMVIATKVERLHFFTTNALHWNLHCVYTFVASTVYVQRVLCHDCKLHCSALYPHRNWCIIALN